MKPNRTIKRSSQGIFKRKALVAALLSVVAPISTIQAQTSPQSTEVEEVVVTGSIRDTVRNSIELKRESSTIVDAISASDIGTLPDLSVGETLERITGVTADRFKGQSNELSIRGLGPFLVFSTYNGREVSSGSGNRSVAFSQFPSELVNRAVVYKAQQADIIEGGVAGSINLASIRPIDYGKRRIQGEFKLNLNEGQAKFKNDDGFGYRGSFSYTDVFDTDAGTFGFAVGIASTDGSAPDEAYAASSVFRPCNSDGVVDIRSNGRVQNCDFDTTNEGITDADGNVVNQDFYWVSNGHTWRQQQSDDTRDAIIATAQWQPNEDWDITLDYQFSERFFNEDRRELALNDGRRAITNVETTTLNGLTSFRGNSRFSSNASFREREEDYQGIGLNVAWQATDDLRLTADLSASSTVRFQQTWQTSVRSEFFWYDFNVNRKEFPEITALYETIPTERPELGAEIVNFEQELFQDLSFFDRDNTRNNAGAQFREFRNEDDIYAFRLRADLDLDGDFFTSVSTGIRYSDHEYNGFAEDRFRFDNDTRNPLLVNTTANNRTIVGTGVSDIIAAGCQTEFPQRGFASDSSSDTITEWATYDPLCGFNAIVGNNPFSLTPSDPSNGDIILNEKVASIFAMANFETNVGDMPLSGNFGVRVVEYRTDATGFRSDFAFTVTEFENSGNVGVSAREILGSAAEIKIENDYINVLPSLNLNLGLSDQINLRAAFYRSVSRPDMWWLGSGRDLSIQGLDSENETFDSFQAAIEERGQLNARGNPRMETIESDNVDLSIAFYPNEDTQFSLAVYHKKFNAGFGPADPFEETVNVEVERFIDRNDQGMGVDDIPPESQGVTQESFTLPVVGLIDIQDEQSYIIGAEISVNYTFSSLPSPWNGLGVKAGYNYADTSFETSENRSEILNELDDVETIFPLVNDIDEFVQPSALNGFSRESYTFETYWEKFGWQARIAYKFRSQYLRNFGNNLNTTNRLNADQDSMDASLSYRINKNLSVRLQGLNLLNKPLVQYAVHNQNTSFVSYDGRKYFAGIRFRF